MPLAPPQSLNAPIEFGDVNGAFHLNNRLYPADLNHNVTDNLWTDACEVNRSLNPKCLVAFRNVFMCVKIVDIVYLTLSPRFWITFFQARRAVPQRKAR